MAMIRVKDEVRKALKGKKLYKKESYNDVLCRLMDKKRSKKYPLRNYGLQKGERYLSQEEWEKRKKLDLMGGLKVVPDKKLLRGLA